MSIIAMTVCALLGLVTSVGVIIRIRKWTAGKGASNHAREFHHMHKTPVSRLGGLALVVAFLVVELVILLFFPSETAKEKTRFIIIVSSLAMFVVGFWDDLRPIGAKKKLAWQFIIASSVYFAGIDIERFRNPFTHELYELHWAGGVLTIFWLVAMTNLINLIDGIDGLAGGVSLILMVLLAYVAHSTASFPYLIASVAGALIGFLYFNFPPAKIYMGDGGAYFLGFLIGILTLVNSQKGTVIAALIAPLFALALPIIDVSLAVLRRGLKGLPIFRPDRSHLHHKLLGVGLSRARAVLLFYGISVVFLLMAFGVFWSQGRWVPILFGFMCVILLLAARSFTFSRQWFDVGRMLENTLELRKETYYALAVEKWLELEAERTKSVEALWTDFTFMGEKMGFTGIALELQDGRREWKSSITPNVESLLQRNHEFGSEQVTRFEFWADGTMMSPRLFEHLCDLTAETWFKAAKRWQEVNALPVRFDSRIETKAESKEAVPSDPISNEVKGAAKSA